MEKVSSDLKQPYAIHTIVKARYLIRALMVVAIKWHQLLSLTEVKIMALSAGEEHF